MQQKWNPAADLILKHARIETVDVTIGEMKSGQYDYTVISDGWISIKDGKIIEVGAGWNPTTLGESTRVLDLGGKTVIPGLIDSHMHGMAAASFYQQAPLDKVERLSEMLEILTTHAEKWSDLPWIQGYAWNELSWSDGQRPDRKVLDTISKEKPVCSRRLCGHVIVVNSKALELAGITKDTPNPNGGTIGHDADGEPNGWLYEPAAMNLVQSLIPDLTEEEQISCVVRSGQKLNSVGLTSVIDANLPLDHMRAYQQAYQRGELTYRANMMFYLDKANGTIPMHLKRLEEMTAVTGFGDDMLKLNGVKILLDGIPASGTAFMRKPYQHVEGRGFTTITPEEVKQVCITAAKYHWQMGIHAIGDAAMDVALDGFEAGNAPENRNYIIHAVFPREDMITRMQKMQVSVTIQPTIMGTMGEEAVLSEEDAALNQPAGLFFQNGIVCGGGTDFPVVDCNPFPGMAKAMNRMALDGKVHGAQYCLNAKQALLMWTKNSAYLTWDDEKLGSIEPGMLADLVVIDTPFSEATAEQIANTKVCMTLLGGKIVFTAE